MMSQKSLRYTHEQNCKGEVVKTEDLPVKRRTTKKVEPTTATKKEEETYPTTKKNCGCSCQITLCDPFECCRNCFNICIESGNCLFHFFKFIFIPLFFAFFIASLIWVFVTKR
jgi:hypothetical protein